MIALKDFDILCACYGDNSKYIYLHRLTTAKYNTSPSVVDDVTIDIKLIFPDNYKKTITSYFTFPNNICDFSVASFIFLNAENIEDFDLDFVNHIPPTSIIIFVVNDINNIGYDVNLRNVKKRIKINFNESHFFNISIRTNYKFFKPFDFMFSKLFDNLIDWNYGELNE